MCLALGLTGCAASPAPRNAPPRAEESIISIDATGDAPAAQKRLELALAEQGFGILFRANMGQVLSKREDRSELDEIRSVMFCNPRYANQAAKTDPDVLALCPLHVTVLEEHGKTRFLFVRPSSVTAGSEAAATISQVEDMVLTALQAASG